jgi:nuclear GTP-binding protein
VVCTTAPIPGETKVWQYITLTRRIYLIDCPGVVPPNPNDSDEDILLRGVVRVENVENPSQYVEAMLRKCQRKHIERTYAIKDWTDVDGFLEALARKMGRLLKGGEPDVNSVAKVVLNDFLRGKIPWYVPPPKPEGEEDDGIKGRLGRLGEMGRKRKRDEEDLDGDENENDDKVDEGEEEEDEDEDEESDQDNEEVDEDEVEEESDPDSNDINEEVDEENDVT